MAYCKQQLFEDAEFIVEKLLNVHPRPESRLGSAAFAKAKGLYLAAAGESTDLSQLWECTAKLMSRLGDAHTFVPPLQRGELCAPVALVHVAGQVVVEDVMPGSAVAAKLDRGDVILFINSIETGQAVKERLELVAYNFYEHGFSNALSQLLRFTAGSGDSVELTVAKADGVVVSIRSELYASDEAAYVDWSIHRQLRSYADFLSWRIIDDLQSGYLKYKLCFDRTSEFFVNQIRQFGFTANELPDMQEVCTALFSELESKGFERLIIDLRGNSGGNSMIARPLFKYLTRKPLRTYGAVVRASREVKELHESTRSKYPAEYQHLLDDILAVPDGQYLQLAGENTIYYPYQAGEWATTRQFDGQVYVLTDANTYSSGEWLAAELRDNELAVFIGEPTGGGGSVPGDTIPFKAPNTGLDFMVSHKLFIRPDREAERLPAVVPHYYVPPALEDFRKGNDTVLEWLKRHLQS